MRDDVQQAPHLEELCLLYITTELCSHLISVSSPLKSLEITGIEDLMSLPVGIQHVSTLKLSQLVIPQLYQTGFDFSHHLQSFTFPTAAN